MDELEQKALMEIAEAIFDSEMPLEDCINNFKHIYSDILQPESNDDLQKCRNAFNLAFEKNPSATIKTILETPIFRKKHGEVFTPEWLINDMVKKLPKSVWKNPNLKWLDNSCGSGNFLVFVKNKLMRTLSEIIPDKNDREKHIVENMLWGVELQAKNCVLAKKRISRNKFNHNVVNENALTFDYWGMQFDIILGNPPYQDNKGNKGTGHTLWDKFVKLAINKLLKPDGYLVYVHPSGWRQYKNPLLEFIKSKQILYLEIHDHNDGNKTFKASTRYDWYVLKNCPCVNKTKIKDQDGIEVQIDLNDWIFIPNSMFNEIKNFIAKSDEEKFEILHSESAYEPRKKWVSEVNDDTYIYPVIYSINKNDSPSLRWSSKNDNGHFGIPKVILSNGAGVIVDEDGNYGLTQWAYGIVDEKENLHDLRKYLLSEDFKKLKNATHLDSRTFNLKIFKFFKKDFWKS